MAQLDWSPSGYGGNKVALNVTYYLCVHTRKRVDWVGARIDLSDVECVTRGTIPSGHRFEIKNPTIDFVHMAPPDHGVTAGSLTLSASDAEFVRPDEPESWIPPGSTPSPYLPGGTVLLLKALRAPCPLTEAEQMSPWTLMQYDGAYYMHDTRLEIIENTVESPANLTRHVAPLSCPNVEKNLFNRDGCVVGRGCAPLRYRNTLITLNETLLRTFYEAGQHYVYRIEGLKYDSYISQRDTFCDHYDGSFSRSLYGATSRWRRVEGGTCNDTFSDVELAQIFRDALNQSLDTNEFMRDLLVKPRPSTASYPGCKDDIGKQVQVGSECWQNIHPMEMNVYDFSRWTSEHPGNAPSFSPITAPAKAGEVVLRLPSSHSMDQWRQAGKLYHAIDLVGRWGDSLPFDDLPDSVKSTDVAEATGQVPTDGPDRVTEMCGSPGEVANDPALGHRYKIGLYGGVFDDVGKLSLLPNHYSIYGEAVNKQSLQAMQALYANDQLRQRVALALSQIFVIASEDIGFLGQRTEPYAHYYDIFVRHAFGSIHQIYREVSWHPLMARYLTYINSQSIDASNSVPDENYAREIMQLFSIGLFELNDDGTPKVDPSTGEPYETYTNDNIVSFAKIWTGFTYELPRGNLERVQNLPHNMVDPMRVRSEWRDAFPKMDLHKGHIGDGYPVCSALGERAFLRVGARFSLLGEDGTPRLHRDQFSVESAAQDDPASPLLTLNTTDSSLLNTLCYGTPVAPTFASTACRFHADTVLTANLPCHGQECAVDTVRVLRVVSPDGSLPPVFFEYVRRPCVELSFFNHGYLVESYTHSNMWTTQCAPPEATAGMASCCTGGSSAPEYIDCEYTNERVTYETAQARCLARSAPSAPPGEPVLCPSNDLTPDGCSNSWPWQLKTSLPMWSNTPCGTSVRVAPDGLVTVGHEFGRADSKIGLPSTDVSSSPSTFRVRWLDGAYPTISDHNCSSETPANLCEPLPELSSCLCRVSVAEAPVFTSVTDLTALATAGDIASELASLLSIGAPPPEHYDSGLYVACATPQCAALGGHGVTLYTQGGATTPLVDANAILHVFVNGTRELYLANRDSTVHLAQGAYSFRNPPSFLSVHEPTSRDAIYEVEALIDHLVYHPNTAPFLAKQLIQFLVTSNPSPRYVRTVANALKTGVYDGKFFSGKYGDLGAAVTALLLDREARSLTLHLDPMYGTVRDPMQRLFHLMRTMEYVPAEGRDVRFSKNRLSEVIGMELFRSPSVFNFFLPQFQPPGPASSAKVVLPASMLGTMPYVVGMINAQRSLIYSGLRKIDNEPGSLGDSTTATGFLTFAASTPADDVRTLDELSLLLTAGRLGPRERQVLEEVYNRTFAEQGSSAALKRIQLLLTSSSAFQTSGALPASKPEGFADSPPRESRDRPYKAIVVVYLWGGVDSFNMLTPLDGCPADSHNHDEYQTARTGAAIPKKDFLNISVPEGSQPCQFYGLHPQLPFIKEQFEAGNLSFTSDIGFIFEPTSKQQFLDGETRKPVALFSHAHQQTSTRTLFNAGSSGSAKGVLGRAVEALVAQGDPDGGSAPPLKVEKYAFGSQEILLGDPNHAPTTLNSGVPEDALSDDEHVALGDLWSHQEGSVMAQTVTGQMRAALSSSRRLNAAVNNVTLKDEASFDQGDMAHEYPGPKLRTISKLILARKHLGTERDVFYVKQGGYDHHSGLESGLETRFKELNQALEAFVTELQANGVYDNVAIQIMSEFGRTLTFNGRGTDHAWSGNYFLLGGQVKGGVVHGQYPSLDVDSDHCIDRRRGTLLPTLPWEAQWVPLLRWFGLHSAAQLEYALPNLRNFANFPDLTSEHLLDVEEVFKVGVSV